MSVILSVIIDLLIINVQQPYHQKNESSGSSKSRLLPLHIIEKSQAAFHLELSLFKIKTKFLKYTSLLIQTLPYSFEDATSC